MFTKRRKKNPIDINTVGGRIREAMDARCVSPAELAREVGANRGYISQILNNDVMNPHKYIAEIAEFLEVSTKWIKKGDGNPEDFAIKRKTLTTHIKATVFGKDKTSTCDIELPWVFKGDVKAWYFWGSEECFSHQTLIITDSLGSFDSGIYLGFEEGSPVIVGRKVTRTDSEFFNKKDNTEIEGKIIFQTRWEANNEAQNEENESR